MTATHDRDDWPTTGWSSAPPAGLGLDEDALAEADCRIQADLVGVHSLVVVRHKAIGFERYYGGCDARTRFDVRSVTKSVVATLVGIAVGDGLLSLSQNLGELLPDRLPRDGDERLGAITIEHLLTMTAGFAWDDLADWGRLWASDDWLATTLRTPLAADPGHRFTYNSGCSHLLSTIVTRVTGKTLAAFASGRLFGPLGMSPAPWPQDPHGYSIGGLGLEFRVRDLAKLGLLYLHGGRWAGVQLVPAAYVAASTTGQSAGGDPEEAAYGYHWWVTSAAGDAAYFAAGYGGQYVYVVPARDLVVVTTARWQLPPAETLELHPLIEDIVLAAAQVEGPAQSTHVSPPSA